MPATRMLTIMRIFARATRRGRPISTGMRKIYLPFLALGLSFAPAHAATCELKPGAICAGEEALDYAALIDRLQSAEIVVIGERHDNPVHHEWQAKITADLSPGGLAFEMIKREKEDFANAARINGDDLAEALDWENSGWPDFEMYRPIFDAAPEAWVSGGGVEADMLRLSVSEGAAAAWPDGAERYGLNERMAQDVIDAMLKEQDIAHCGALPTGMLPGMVEAQQLRDAAFADAVIRLLEADHAPVVLITGNGHARIDRGAPLYLNRAAPERSVLSVGMIELTEKGEPTGGGAPFDFTIYTVAHDRGDPCEAFIRKRQKP